MPDFFNLRFQGSSPLLNEVTAERLNLILQEIRRNKPLPGRGTTITQTGSGSRVDLLSSVSASSVGAALPTKPFEVLSTTVDGATLLGIYEFSTVGTIAANVAIDGLLATSDPIAPDDPGLFAVPAIGDKIWLQIGTADPANPDAAPQIWEATTQIRHGAVGSGNLWEEYPEPIAVNTDDPESPFQEFYNLLLAEVTDPETDPRPALMTITVGSGQSAQQRQITQCWSRNICLVHWVINGLLCLVPSDPAGDYPPAPLP